jgi:hypothetical protein
MDVVQGRLLQLAVLAASPVIGTGIDILTVGLGLARYAAASSWDGLPPGFRDILAAVLAVGETLAHAQSAPGTGDGIIDARIDLFLHRSIVSPTNSHTLILLG